MAFEQIPAGAYAVEPADPGDVDEIDMSVATPLPVGQAGNNAFLLKVNWPDDLTSVRISVVFPSIARPTAGSISPNPNGSTTTVNSNSVVFTIPSGVEGTTYTFTATANAEQAGTANVTFKLDADELDQTVTRVRAIEYEAEQGG